MEAIIVANGRFPTHRVPRGLIISAKQIICCDGSVERIERLGLSPLAIVGDLDSISERLKQKYADRVFFDPDQNTNDLTKAVKWCISHGYRKLSIVAATGKREDHTIGNISLLLDYMGMGATVEMFTDAGVFTPIAQSRIFSSFTGQPVSIITTNSSTKVTSINLKYSLDERQLPSLWMGTLNESLGDRFEIHLSPGSLLVYRGHQP